MTAPLLPRLALAAACALLTPATAHAAHQDRLTHQAGHAPARTATAPAAAMPLPPVPGAPADTAQRLARAQVPMPAGVTWRPLAGHRQLTRACGTSDASACTDPDTSTIYWPAGWDPDPDDLYHELGHAFDGQAMTLTDRQQVARLIGRAVPASYDDWFYDLTDRRGVPDAEYFADTYALCALPPRARHDLAWGHHYVTWGYSLRIDRPHLAGVCRIIRAAGARAGLTA